MSEIPLRQRSPTEIVDAAFQVYRREPLQFILAVALIHVPWLAIRLGMGIGLDDTALPTATQTLVVLIGSTVVYILVAGVTTVIASDVYLDRPSDLARAYRTVASRFMPLLMATLVAVFFMGLGVIAFILPMFYVLARFFAIRQVVLIEDGSAGRALSRSSALSSGTKRDILNTLILVGLLVFAINIGALSLLRLVPSHIAQQTLAEALSSVVYPFFGITETLLYYDMRIRKEGFDVEYLASTGEGIPSPPTPA